jgi:hypothetical protein
MTEALVAGSALPQLASQRCLHRQEQSSPQGRPTLHGYLQVRCLSSLIRISEEVNRERNRRISRFSMVRRIRKNYADLCYDYVNIIDYDYVHSFIINSARRSDTFILSFHQIKLLKNVYHLAASDIKS